MRLGRCQQSLLIELAKVQLVMTPLLSDLVAPIRDRGFYQHLHSWWRVRMRIRKVAESLERYGLVRVGGSDMLPVSDPSFIMLTPEGMKLAIALTAAEELER